MGRDIAELTHSQYAGLAVDFLFSRPIFSSSHFVEMAGIPRQTALRFLGALRDAQVLRTMRGGSGRRPAIFAFPALMNIAEGRVVL
jgi:hypothetical protein